MTKKTDQSAEVSQAEAQAQDPLPFSGSERWWLRRVMLGGGDRSLGSWWYEERPERVSWTEDTPDRVPLVCELECRDQHLASDQRAIERVLEQETRAAFEPAREGFLKSAAWSQVLQRQADLAAVEQELEALAEGRPALEARLRDAIATGAGATEVEGEMAAADQDAMRLARRLGILQQVITSARKNAAAELWAAVSAAQSRLGVEVWGREAAARSELLAASAAKVGAVLRAIAAKNFMAHPEGAKALAKQAAELPD
jgi:hypothetical protein